MAEETAGAAEPENNGPVTAKPEQQISDMPKPEQHVRDDNSIQLSLFPDDI
jgi:hypothetical protein